ncbi:hypothetical protein D3C86_1806980 [compost metagenome]
MPLLAHQVDAGLVHRAHPLDELSHQTFCQALSLKIRMHHHRHDDHMRAGRVVADQFLERLVRHFHFKRRAGVDETGDDAVHFGHDKALGPGGDAGRYFFPGRGFVTFVGKGFDGVAAVQVSGGDVANDGVHVGSNQRGKDSGS